MPGPVPPCPGPARRLGLAGADLLRDAAAASMLLFKALVPAVIAVKILQELGLISWLAWPLAPVMALVGLPAAMGLVWATAMLNSIYAAMAVFVTLAPAAGLTQAQTTVLCVMILMAHSLPVELKVARQCGAALWPQAAIRVGAGLACGMLLHGLYSAWGGLSGPGTVLWSPGGQPASLRDWALAQAWNLAAIFIVIVALMALMRLFKALRVTDLLVRLLGPLLKLVGIGPAASTITVIGLAMGLTYGGGLIILEARSGRVGPRDVFYSLTFMGLTHALIEDTLLMLALGAHLSGVLWGRLLFSLALLAGMVRLTSGLSEAAFARRFLRPT